jgi:hypothetical protein
MMIVKTRLHNRMEDNFLANYLIVYIKKKCWKIHNWYDNRWFIFYKRMTSTIRINM